MAGIVLLNGAFVPQDQATVSVYDGSFLHGAGLFETMRAEHRRVFRLDAHVDRLLRSAETLQFPIEREQLPSADDLETLLTRNDLKRARLRLTVTSGPVLAEPGHPQPNICATASEQAGYPDELYRTGVTVVITQYRQSTTDPLAGHKTTNYLPRLMALRAAQAHRCTEALWFTPQNLLAEGSVSNVFIVKDGEVATPPVDTPVLPGIARSAVLELCQAASIEAREQAITIDNLLDADEVFLTNVAMLAMPVARVERKDIGDGKPGEITRRLLADFHALIAKECQTDD